jgi:putative AlgH/UPF0301 family transcriptional regulator
MAVDLKTPKSIIFMGGPLKTEMYVISNRLSYSNPSDLITDLPYTAGFKLIASQNVFSSISTAGNFLGPLKTTLIVTDNYLNSFKGRITIIFNSHCASN